MPKIQRRNIPEALMRHMLQRVREREITMGDLESLVRWLDRNPEVPSGDWFKRFNSFTLVGKGSLPSSFLKVHMYASGKEVE